MRQGKLVIALVGMLCLLVTPAGALYAGGEPVLVKGGSGLDPRELTNVNGTLFFSSLDAVNGRGELWKSDGTQAGTVLVKDFNPGAGPRPSPSSPTFLTNVNGTLFFNANDGEHGEELWKSDGTAAGTVLVKDINPEAAGSVPGDLTNVNGTLVFSATDGVNGFELWRSDGTAAGTILVKDINPGPFDSFPFILTNVNGTLFFVAHDGEHGRELWKSDGTAAGTVLVKDINPGPSPLDSFPFNLTNVNGTLFLVADDGVHGRELWKSDGTAAGTVFLKDINPGAFGSDPANLTTVDGTLFFSAFDPVNGFGLWKLGSADSLEGLAAIISDMGIPASLKQSLLDKVQAAEQSLARGNTNAAKNQLSALINQAQGQRGQQLTNDQADLIIAYATGLIATL